MVLLLGGEDLGEGHLGSLEKSWGWKDIEHLHRKGAGKGVAADHREAAGKDYRIGSICLDRDFDSFVLK